LVSRSRVRALGLALSLLLVVGATACGGSDKKASTPTTSGANGFVLWAPSDIQSVVDRTLRVYKQRFPDVAVTTVYETQADLNDRFLQGERPDLFIGTGAGVSSLVNDGTLPQKSDIRLFGTDALVIAVAPGNPKKINDYTPFGLDPLTRSGLCKPDIGCGRAARTVLADLHIVPAPDESDPSANNLIQQVAQGGLDAAIVYRSDAVQEVRDNKISIVRVGSGEHGTTDYRLVVVHPGEAVDSYLRFLQRSKTVDSILLNAGLSALVPPQPGQGQHPAKNEDQPDQGTDTTPSSDTPSSDTQPN
jgi:molybdate transport system substrate-binding protein